MTTTTTTTAWAKWDRVALWVLLVASALVTAGTVLSSAIRIVARVVLACGSILSQFLVGFGSWNVVVELTTGPLIDGFWPLVMRLDPAPIALGFGLLLVASAFEFSARLGRDLDGLV
jgi:hypothetical protein